MTMRQRGLIWVLCLTLGASFFYGIHGLPLRDYREARYAELGREILEGNDWLVLHLNESPYFNKPPMVPWLVALSFKILGLGEGAARLPSVLAVLWAALVMGWMTCRIFGRGKGILGAVLFLGAPGIQYFGRMLMSDTLAMAWVLSATAAFLEGYLRGHLGWYRLGFLACGLGVLSRGLIGVVYPLGTLLVFFLLVDRKAWKGVPWITGFLLFLAVTLPWFALVEIKHPGFLHHHLVQQQFERFLGKHPFVAVPRWRVLLSFAGFLGPMVFLLPWTIGTVQGKQATHRILWILASLVMGSVILSAGRNDEYTLPALPPLVALVAGRLGGLNTDSPPFLNRGPAVLTGLLGATILGGLPWVAQILDRISPFLGDPATRILVQISIATMAIFFLVGSLLLWQGRGAEACATLAVLMIPGAWMLTHVQQQMACLESRAFLAGLVAREIPPTWPLVIADPRDRQFEATGGWSFYTRRRVLMVAFESPARGPFQGASRPDWILDVQDLIDLWASGRSLALAATPEALPRLPLGTLPLPRARDGKFSLWVFKGER